MKIRVLGAHCFESRNTRLSSILIDDVLAVDAGGLTSSLSFAEQSRIDAVLLTHGHYDHIRDVPALALKNNARTIDVYAVRKTLDVLATHLIDGLIYPDFTRWPSAEKPALRLNPVEPLHPRAIRDYEVLAVPVPHAVTAVGYQIMDKGGRKVFISGDTGPGLASCWEHIEPDMLIMDVTFPDRLANIALGPGHLCPSLLGKELVDFQRLRGYLPRVVFTHLSPEAEDEIREEGARLAAELGVEITIAHEDMVL